MSEVFFADLGLIAATTVLMAGVSVVVLGAIVWRRINR